jgi:hypothetical protein
MTRVIFYGVVLVNFSHFCIDLSFYYSDTELDFWHDFREICPIYGVFYSKGNQIYIDGMTSPSKIVHAHLRF